MFLDVALFVVIALGAVIVIILV
eukprot:COSAG02_NODE_30259_length_554_cov_1.415385_1_plen_22_part_10